MQAFARRTGPATLALGLVAGVLSALMLALTAKDGGYSETVWLPTAVFVVLLLGIASWFLRPRLDRAALVAAGGLLAFTLVLGASIGWAGVRGDAWTGADRGIYYLALFALGVVLPWTPGAVTLALGLYGIGVTTITLWQFLAVAHAPAVHADLFIAGRLATPVSYPNAVCALLMGAVLPLLLLAARRSVPLLARGLFLAGAGISLELAILCQSRIFLLAAPLVLIVLLLASPTRIRLVLTAVPVGVVVAVALRPLLDVYDATLLGVGGSELAAARRAVLASGAVLLVAGWALAALDLRFPATASRRRAALAASVAALVAAAAAGALAGDRIAPHPIAFVREQWHAFADGGYTDQRGSHFSSAGTNRYDIWRVAAHEFVHSPIGGIGADNFAAPYLQLRKTVKESPLYPHSNVLMVLSETGVLGALGFAVFLGGAVAAVGGSLRRRQPDAVVVLAAAAPSLYFLVHGLGDWLWEVPALGTASIAFLGMAVGLASRTRGEAPPRSIPRPIVLPAALAAVVVLFLPWLAARELAAASAHWPSDPGLAFDRLRLAGHLNPLSDLPPETEGLIAARLGEDERARDAFARAVERNGSNWYSRLELAVMEARLGRRERALAEVRRSAELDPLESIVKTVGRRLASGRTVTQAQLDDLLQAEDRLG